MNLTRIMDKTAFNNSITKLILNVKPIEAIIDDFAQKTFDEWEERECDHCKERKCKKHRALDRVLESEKAVRVTGFDVPDNVAGVFVSKSDIFVINSSARSALIVDCPPFQTSNETAEVSDTWIRRIIPFTFGNFEKENELEIVQEVELDKIFSYRILSCPFGRVGGEDGRRRSLVMHNCYGEYHWELE